MASGPSLVAAREPCTLAIASYNVHRCIGGDGSHDPARIAAVLRELDADVIGLQEVAARDRGPGAVDQLAYLARAIGFEAVAGPTFVAGGSRCGNGLLTRLPILSVERLDLTVAGREPRGALDVRLAADGAVVRVIVTHLGLRRTDRRTQASRLLATVGDDQAQLVLLGDINEWLPRGGCLRRLDARLGRSRSVRSFPARRPFLPLDRIWVQPHSGLAAFRAHRSTLARVASDHLPVIGTVTWAAVPC